MHWLGDGHVRVSVCFEDESQRKDDAIVALKEEVSALRLQLSQKKQGDPDVTHRLRCLENDIKEKKDQIQQLKEQVWYYSLLCYFTFYIIYSFVTVLGKATASGAEDCGFKSYLGHPEGVYEEAFCNHVLAADSLSYTNTKVAGLIS